MADHKTNLGLCSCNVNTTTIDETIDVEVIISDNSVSKSSVESVVQKFLEANPIFPNTVITEFDENAKHFQLLVKSVMVGNCSRPICGNCGINFKDRIINWFIYTLDRYGPIVSSDTDDEGQQINFATYFTLPSSEFYSLWENLYYEENIKENLLKYAMTILEFSNKGINPAVISCNKVLLLYGPPGTGKTSLCKALAQKLSVRMLSKYSSTVLIEINSHSLFSRWFSESGKLVNRMFSKIQESCENENVLVCVLIDEVESLVHARDSCIAGNEPSDSVRVVNAMLTQIDQIKRFPNVIILATSNMTEAIDCAFVDRADIKQFLGLPNVASIYNIYRSCLLELMKVQIINSTYNLAGMEIFAKGDDSQIEHDEYVKNLLSLCKNSIGLSGRILRKIPFLAHALYVVPSKNAPLDLNLFIEAMSQAVKQEIQNKIDLIKK